MTGPYDDMLNLPHPTSRRHPQMSLSDRAAQFAPFAALSGHSAALVETARLTERRIELDEDVKAALDLKQQMLMDRMIQESGHFEVDPSLEDYIDYQSYGERRVQEEGGLFGDRGYVAYLGTKPEMKEIMARNIPAERMEQGPQMGGLT